MRCTEKSLSNQNGSCSPLRYKALLTRTSSDTNAWLCGGSGKGNAIRGANKHGTSAKPRQALCCINKQVAKADRTKCCNMNRLHWLVSPWFSPDVKTNAKVWPTTGHSSLLVFTDASMIAMISTNESKPYLSLTLWHPRNRHFRIRELISTSDIFSAKKHAKAFNRHDRTHYVQFSYPSYIVELRGLQIFQGGGGRPRSRLQILGATALTQSKFHTEKLQFWRDLWTSLHADFCSVQTQFRT